MNAARVLYQMVRADFLERVRRYSFLVTLGFSLYLGFAVYRGQVTLQLDQYRGVDNSAWLGAVIGLVGSVWISLVGFYIVKNTIQRDRETRVGQILASTPMSKAFYTLGKSLSNFAVLGTMILVLAVAAVAIGAFGPHTGPLELGPLLAPLLALGLTSVAITAALAVLFESLPVLRGGVGNVAYFFLWVVLMSVSAASLDQAGPNPGVRLLVRDATGLLTVMTQMQTQLHHLDPQYSGGASFSVGGLHPTTKTFLWPGLNWTPAVLESRALQAGIAVLLALLAAVFFDRFDPSRGMARPRLTRKKKAEGLAIEAAAAVDTASGRSSPTVLARMDRGAVRTRMVALVGAELRLMLKGKKWWWYAVAAGLFVACVASPVVAGRAGILPAAWIWPLLIWSQMGAREQHGTVGALIFSGVRAAPRQMAASYAAGVLVAVAAGGGLALRLVIAADWPGLAAWAAGALFIPAMALACGALSGTPKLFEGLYTGWWYMGPLHSIRGLDFVGTTPMSSTPGRYAVAAAVLVVSAYGWRRMRLAAR